MAGQGTERTVGVPRFLERVLALNGHTQGRGIAQKLIDAYGLGPLFGNACRTGIEDPGRKLASLLSDADCPIHWIRPGGIGDWAVLAPFIEGVLRVRRHPGDCLWVPPAARAFALHHHFASGLQIRDAGLAGFLSATPPGLVLQLEPFHPTAWIWAALLRPRWAAGYAPKDPSRLEGPPVRPVVDDLAAFHPAVHPVRPAPADRRAGILVFAEGNHKSRGLPVGFQRALRDQDWDAVSWFGPPGESVHPSKGWSWSERPWPADRLMETIRSARLVISPDSGPFHLARLLGTPAVGYFTSGESLRWGWAEPESRVVLSSFECTACTRIALPAPCPYSYGCRNSEDIRTIIQAAESLL